jgi:hypothetical protein
MANYQALKSPTTNNNQVKEIVCCCNSYFEIPLMGQI